MKLRPTLITAALAGVLTITSAHAEEKTPGNAGEVKTRIGTLNFERGYPTEETARKVYDEMDFQRAVQAYLWAYPAVSFESIKVGSERDLGAGDNVMAIADKFVDSRGVWLTANDTTIYAVTNIDLGKSGPMVVEVPPGKIVGLICDFWQRAITDLGLPGPDGDKGGKFLLLPPGYKGDVPGQGYHVLQGTQHNYNIMVRGILSKLEDAPEVVALVKSMRVYPWSEREAPKPLKIVTMSGKAVDTLPPAGLEYWARLSTFINANPVDTRDRFFMAMLKPLGIVKDKPFKPDGRQRALLEEATKVGDAMGRTLLFDAEQRFNAAKAFPDTHWNWVVIMDYDQESEYYSQFDERLHYMYGAIYMSPAIGTKKAGPGSTYIQAFRDKDGNRLDGGKSYRLHVPGDVPAAAFWSLTLYDTATRSMIQNSRNDSARSSYDKLQVNADGSTDIYFGAKAPAGKEGNWIETVLGKGFYPMFRFYTPKEGLFDGSWRMPDVELVK